MDQPTQATQAASPHTTLAALVDAHERFVQTNPTRSEGQCLGVRVSVHGQFLRKRKLSYVSRSNTLSTMMFSTSYNNKNVYPCSKGLIFGDISLANNDPPELLELMFRAQGGLLTFDQVRQINWDVHLGDLVTIEGFFDTKGEGRWILHVLEITVNESWRDNHPGEFFDHIQFGNITTYEPGQFTNPPQSTRTSPVAAADTAASTGNVPRGSTPLAPNSQADAPQKYTNIVQINGFNTCKFYFAGGAEGANCLRGQQCHFWHGLPQDYEANRKLWMAKRKQQRQNVSHIDGDHHDPREKLLKDNRARIFCDWIIHHIGEEQLKSGTGVVDVAGGKGEIPIQLWNLRGIRTTLVEPRTMKLSKKNLKIVQANNTKGIGKCPQVQCFLNEVTWREHAALFANCTLLVGMHPDEATEIIVDIALQHNKPFAVVPCCVMSRVFPNRKCRDGQAVDNYDTFVRYLMEKDPRIQKEFLSFEGKNQVLYLFKYD